MFYLLTKNSKLSTPNSELRMKSLPINSPAFRYIEQSFKEWLDIMGYTPSSVYQMPNLIRELLNYLENNGVENIKDINNKNIKEYYNQLKMRPNMRRGGGLQVLRLTGIYTPSINLWITCGKAEGWYFPC